MRIAVFCEAAADFATAAGLIDRVSAEEGPAWVREHLETRPWSDLREWVEARHDQAFSLATLRARDEESGLRAYLDEIRDRLTPLWR